MKGAAQVVQEKLGWKSLVLMEAPEWVAGKEV